MCVTAIIAAAVAVTAAAGAGAYTSIKAASANQAAARYEAKIRTKQLYEQREMARIAALEDQNDRSEEFNQARSAAMAAIGASGLGEHISFFQGIDPQAQKAFLRDVRNIRLNLAQREASIADEVGVTAYRRDISVYNSKLSKIGAIADFIQTAASAASFYGMNAAPAAAGAGGTSITTSGAGAGSGIGPY